MLPSIQLTTMPLFDNFFPAHVIALTSDRSVDFTLTAKRLSDNVILENSGAENKRLTASKLDGNPILEQPPIQKDLTENQKQFLSAAVDFSLTKIANIRQVHGDKVSVADEHYCQNDHVLEEADGLITRVVNLPLAIRTADCLPVFLYDTKQECIGLVHVGWQGSQKKIIEKAIKLMEQLWCSDVKNIKVAFGPAIHSCCYEVGQEFQELFEQECAMKDGRLYFDLPQASKNQLIGLGVLDENILDCGICTCCDQRYFSYRREGKSTGRMVSVMMLKKET